MIIKRKQKEFAVVGGFRGRFKGRGGGTNRQAPRTGRKPRNTNTNTPQQVNISNPVENHGFDLSGATFNPPKTTELPKVSTPAVNKGRMDAFNIEAQADATLASIKSKPAPAPSVSKGRMDAFNAEAQADATIASIKSKPTPVTPQPQIQQPKIQVKDSLAGTGFEGIMGGNFTPKTTQLPKTNNVVATPSTPTSVATPTSQPTVSQPVQPQPSTNTNTNTGGTTTPTTQNSGNPSRLKKLGKTALWGTGIAAGTLAATPFITGSIVGSAADKIVTD